MDMATTQNAEIIWREGAPISAQYDDPYYSLADGLAEARHVFLAGNGLPDRFRIGFHIAELGFGTGLNAIAALQAWRQSGVAGVLKFTSFEAWPVTATDMERALAHWPELEPEASLLCDAWASGARQITLADFALEVIVGDARETVPRWKARADAWFLDGFSPSKNPELWETDLIHAVADHTAPTGTCATYSAAGHVRRALGAAGFEVQRCDGFGRKRHMTTGRLSP